MTREELIAKITKLAGDQRNKSFPFAANYALDHGFTDYLETGCYRGIDGDGYSTLILASLAAHVGGTLVSYELSEHHIALAKELTGEFADYVHFVQGDSVENLSRRLALVQFAYLDSFDFWPNNPGPAQRHQLAEVGAVLGKMTRPGLILLDDCNLPHGGKAGLVCPFLEEHGWKLVHNDYQRVYVQE